MSLLLLFTAGRVAAAQGIGPGPAGSAFGGLPVGSAPQYSPLLSIAGTSPTGSAEAPRPPAGSAAAPRPR